MYSIFAPDSGGDNLWGEGCPAWKCETLFLAVRGMPPISAKEMAALEHDYRYANSQLVRERSQIVLLAYRLDTQTEIAQVVLAFLPPYSPDLQPGERLWRQWRPNVTHNHVRDKMDDLQADSDWWLREMEANPQAVLQALGPLVTVQPIHKVA